MCPIFSNSKDALTVLRSNKQWMCCTKRNIILMMMIFIDLSNWWGPNFLICDMKQYVHLDKNIMSVSFVLAFMFSVFVLNPLPLFILCACNVRNTNGKCFAFNWASNFANLSQGHNTHIILFLCNVMLWMLQHMWPSTTKGTSCRPGLFWDNEQNSV